MTGQQLTRHYLVYIKKNYVKYMFTADILTYLMTLFLDLTKYRENYHVSVCSAIYFATISVKKILAFWLLSCVVG